MTTEHTFTVEKTCPVCGQATRIVKVKSRLIATQVDNDYCCHYRDFNPYLYHIWVCEKCGFAADEKVFLTAMPETRRVAVAKALQEKHIHFEFSEERSVPDAIASWRLAIYCAEVLQAPLARQAGLAMRLAWVYRLSEQPEEEKKSLEQALNLYIRSLATEHYPIESLTDNTVMYLIGAIYVHLGENKKAVQYLSRLVGDKNTATVDDKLQRDARKLWQQVRESNPEHTAEKGQANPAQAGEKKTDAKPAKKKSGLRRWF